MKQNRVPRIEYSGKEPSKFRANHRSKDRIVDGLVFTDPRGQWAHPGQITEIPGTSSGTSITMDGVNYPVQGVDDTGYSQMMYPGMDYTFPGQYVTEYPMARYGGGLPRAQVGRIIEQKINSWLEEPMAKGEEASTSEEGEEDIDNVRHLMTGRYTAEAIANKFPNWMQYSGIPQAAGFLGSTGLGVGHELSSNKYTADDPGDYPNYTFWDTISEAGEDILNNTVGAGVGALPISADKKTSFLRYLSDNNMLPDGVANKKANMYFKPFGGQNTKTHTHMAQGGWLDEYQTKGEVKPKKVSTSTNYYTSNPIDYKNRLKAYNDSLSNYEKGVVDKNAYMKFLHDKKIDDTIFEKKDWDDVAEKWIPNKHYRTYTDYMGETSDGKPSNFIAWNNLNHEKYDDVTGKPFPITESDYQFINKAEHDYIEKGYYTPPAPTQKINLYSDFKGKDFNKKTGPPIVPKSKRRGIQKIGLNIHKPGANKFGFKNGGWLDTYDEGGEKPWSEMTPKERAVYLDAKETNKKAETKSRAQAKKEHINEYIINSTKEALTHPIFSAPAYFTPQGAMIGAGQAAINTSKNIYEGNYKTAAFDALGVLPLLKQLKNIPKSIKKVPIELPGSPNAPKGKMYGENQVLTQQSRLLDPKIKAKFFEHQAPEIEAKIQSNILGEKLWKAPKDYGNRITPENYEEFVKKIHGSTNYDLAANSWKKPENLGIGNYGKPGTVYSDAPLNNLGKDIINAHEKNHGIFAGTMSTEMEKDLLKPFGTNKPVPFYQSKHQPDEVLARMAQFKNAIGMSDNQPFTLDHLNLIRKNYANSFLDNGITEMLNKIKPGSSGEKHFLNNMNKYAFGVGAPAAIGASALQEEEDGGWLDDEYKRGGQKRKKYTSKNIQSSVNDIFTRNETLFGPAGKKRYKPGLKYKDGGGWLDKYQDTGEVVPKDDLNEDQQFLINMVNSPLFNERYAKMTGQNMPIPYAPNNEESSYNLNYPADQYKKDIINNINTVKYASKGEGDFDPKNYEGEIIPSAYYVPGLESKSGKEFKDSFNNLTKNSSKFNKFLFKDEFAHLSDKLKELEKMTHKIYISDKEDRPYTRTHETSHASTKGELNTAYPYNAENRNPYKNFGKKWEDYHDSQYDNPIMQKYLSQPSEIKARVDAARKYMMDKGLYDPINKKFTNKEYNKLLRITDEDNINDLKHNFSKEDIIRMFNEIVTNKPKTQPVAKMGGNWLDNLH